MANPGGGVRLRLLDVASAPGGARVPVLEEAARLEGAGVLEVHGAPDPKSLAAELRGWGYSTELEDGAPILRVGRSALPRLQDLSELEPPGPLEQVLLAIASLPAGAVFLARLPRFPRMLPPHLEQRHVDWEVEVRPDTTALLWVRAK